MDYLDKSFRLKLINLILVKSHKTRCKLNPTKWKLLNISTSFDDSFSLFSDSNKIPDHGFKFNMAKCFSPDSRYWGTLGQKQQTQALLTPF